MQKHKSKLRSAFKLFLLCSSIPAFLSFYDIAQAQEFQVDYDVRYDINDEGQTTVTQEIELENLTDEYYASEYSLTVNSIDVKNVKASDRLGEIDPDIITEDDYVTLRIPFNAKVVGLNSRQKIKVIYEADNVTERRGSLWEVVIPRMANTRDVGRYNVRVNVPKSFGAPSTVHPLPISTSNSVLYTEYLFDKEAMVQFGALLTFGDIQYYRFSLKYHLKNPRNNEILTQIALPPDVKNHQEVVFTSLTPRPTNIEIDQDGNYIATYHLKAQELVEVNLEGVVKVKASTESRQSTWTLDSIPEEIAKVYANPLPYWPADDPAIAEIVAEQTQGMDSVYDKSQALYFYVVNTLTYSRERLKGEVERFGALKALEKKDEAVCMEYTDLLITLLRSAGIPAREVDGYAYTPDTEYLPTIGDVLHAWVEVYVPPHGWVSVDPTWGSTTGGLDYFNRGDASHVYFSIKGIDSDWPYPAGAYKLSPDQTGDINVRFANEQEIEAFERDAKSIVVEPSFPSAIFQADGLPFNPKVEINNLQTLGVSAKDVRVKAIYGDHESKEISIPYIPPFSSVEVQFEFQDYIYGYRPRSTPLEIYVSWEGEGSDVFWRSPDVISIPYYFYITLIAGGGALGILLLKIFSYVRVRRQFR